MKPLAPALISEKNKVKNAPIFLYTVHDYDGDGHNLNFAAYDVDVVFAGTTYTRFPIAHEAISENSNGQIDSLKIRVANVNRQIQGYLEIYDLRGKQVDIITVFSGYLNNAAYKAVDTFYIDSVTADQNAVEFAVSSKFDVLDVTIPQRKFIRSFCGWKFKGTECAYVGAATACNKTATVCRALGNYSRFGAFPSVPQQRTYIQ